MTMAHLSVNERAARYAKALVSTTERYINNMVTKATWDKHMAGLWGQIERDPRVKARVQQIIDPLGMRELERGSADYWSRKR